MVTDAGCEVNEASNEVFFKEWWGCSINVGTMREKGGQHWHDHSLLYCCLLDRGEASGKGQYMTLRRAHTHTDTVSRIYSNDILISAQDVREKLSH